MHIIVVAATEAEIAPFVEIMRFDNKNKSISVEVKYTGVGLLSASVALTQIMLVNKPELIIQAGIAGCFNENISLGNVLVVKNETLADTGVEENNAWLDLFDLKLIEDNTLPFSSRKLPNDNIDKLNLLHCDEVTAITVNEVTTNKQRRQQLVEKYQPIPESMEGAALHYTGRLFNVPFLQIRSISNYIGERDKSKWKMKDAIQNLNNTLVEYFKKIESKTDEDKSWL